MNLIIRKCGEGKTTEMLKRSAATGAVIVVPTASWARKLPKMAASIGLTIPDPLSYTELLNGALRGRPKTHLLLDDVDRFLMSLGGPDHSVDAVTWTEWPQNDPRFGDTSHSAIDWPHENVAAE